jgi:O-antigen ligase
MSGLEDGRTRRGAAFSFLGGGFEFHGRIMKTLNHQSGWRSWFGAKEFALMLFLTAGDFKSYDWLESMQKSLRVDWTALTAAVVALLVLRELSKRNWSVPGSFWVIFYFFLLFVPALLITNWYGYANTKAMRFFTLSFLSMIAPLFLIDGKASLRRFLIALVAVSLLKAVEGSFAMLTGRVMEARLDLAGHGEISFARRVGFLALVILILTLDKKISVFLSTGALGLLSIILLAVGQRGPMLACAIMMMIVLMLQGNWFKKLIMVGLSVWIISAAFSWSLKYIPEGSLTRVDSFFRGELGTSEQTRLEYLDDADELILKHPGGIGFGGFSYYTYGVTTEDITYPHNLFLEILCEGGWLACFVFLCLFLATVKKAYRLAYVFPRALEYKVLFALLLYLFLNNQVSGDLNDYRDMFCCMAIVMASATTSGERRIPTDHTGRSTTGNAMVRDPGT